MKRIKAANRKVIVPGTVVKFTVDNREITVIYDGTVINIIGADFRVIAEKREKPVNGRIFSYLRYRDHHNYLTIGDTDDAREFIFRQMIVDTSALNTALIEMIGYLPIQPFC